MDGPAIITWNFTNWLTVMLMVTVGFAVLRLAQSFIPKGE